MSSSTPEEPFTPPIHRKRLLAFVNHFLGRTTQFLNDFAREAEARMLEIEKRIQRLERGVLLIEQKLDSVQNTEERTQRSDGEQTLDSAVKEEKVERFETEQKLDSDSAARGKDKGNWSLEQESLPLLPEL